MTYILLSTSALARTKGQKRLDKISSVNYVQSSPLMALLLESVVMSVADLQSFEK